MNANITIDYIGCLVQSRKYNTITSGSVGTATAAFTFDESWNAFPVKTAVFATRHLAKRVILNSDNSCVIPWEVLEEDGVLEIGVVGQNGENIFPSIKTDVYIAEGVCADASNSDSPSLDVYEQIVQVMQEAVAVAQSVRDDAAAGKFNGKDGVSVTHEWNDTTLTITSASGSSSADLRGLPGATPQRGVDYWTPEDEAIILGFIEQHADSALSTRVKDGILYVQTIPSIKSEVKDNVLFIKQGD